MFESSGNHALNVVDILSTLNLRLVLHSSELDGLHSVAVLLCQALRFQRLLKELRMHHSKVAANSTLARWIEIRH
jgi:hypothetical protein